MRFVHVVRICTYTLAVEVSLSGPARSQTGEEVPRGGVQFSPSFRTDLIYDENLFFSSGREGTAASYLAFSPGLQVTRQAKRFSLDGVVSATSELFFNELEPLSEALARGEASAGIRLTPNERTSISARGEYVSTLRPGELIPDTGLELGRLRGWGASGSVGFSRLTSARTAVTLQYDLSWTALDSRVYRSSGNLAHNLTANWSFGKSARSAFSLSYFGRLYQYAGLPVAAGPIDLSDSHVLSCGVVRRLSRKVAMELQAGPRFTNAIDSSAAEQGAEPSYRSRVVPEVLAGISYDARRSQYSAAYSRSQSQTFGFSGFVNTESLSFTAALRPNRSLSFGASLAVFRDTRAEQEIHSHTVQANGSFNLSSWLRVEGVYSFRRQDGDLFLGTDAQQFRTRNAGTLSFVLGNGISSF